jgi:hypothetical protein
VASEVVSGGGTSRGSITHAHRLTGGARMVLFDRLRLGARRREEPPTTAAVTSRQDALQLIDEGNAIEDGGRLLGALERYQAALRLHNAPISSGERRRTSRQYRRASSEAPCSYARPACCSRFRRLPCELPSFDLIQSSIVICVGRDGN